jgi:hypothetical protein
VGFYPGHSLFSREEAARESENLLVQSDLGCLFDFIARLLTGTSRPKGQKVVEGTIRSTKVILERLLGEPVDAGARH